MAIFSDDEQNKPAAPVEKTGRSKELSKKELVEEKTYEQSIRPKTFDTYIGQGALKANLRITLEAAKKRNKPLDHLLFYGPPGLGKTTLAGVIANEMGASIRITSAPALERPRDIIGILVSLKENEILFIDEIHRLNKIAEEILYPAMEDFFLDMTTGKSQNLKTLRVPLPKFTLIGATTKAGSLSGALRDRFGLMYRMEFYTTEELSEVILRTAGILGIKISKDAAVEIAGRSRGTPRIANRLIKRVSDYALVKNGSAEIEISKQVADEALNNLKIDKSGLDNVDRELLSLIAEKYNGGPVGIETLAAALGEDTKTIEDVYEPFLLQSGLIQRTPRGRKISPAAYNLLGIKTQYSQQLTLG